MARSRKLSPERKAFINSLIEHYHPEDAQDVQDMLKDLLGDTLQGMLSSFSTFTIHIPHSIFAQQMNDLIVVSRGG